MEMIDLYVSEVGGHLPAKNREDIEKEIRSLIEDTLEDRGREAGKAPDEEMLVAVLQEMGSPQKVAASYLPARYLIGPELYPHFINTLRIVLSIVAVVAAVTLGVSLGWASQLPAGFAEALGKAALGLLDSLFRAAAVVTLVFAILQWSRQDVHFGEKAWNPREMKPEPDQEDTKPGGAIAEIVINGLALAALNVYPQWIGFSAFVDGQWLHAPILSDVFFQQFLPWISLYLALKMALYAALLAQGRWQIGTRWASVLLSVFAIGLGVAVLFSPSIIAIDPAAFARLGWGEAGAEVLRTSSQMTGFAVRIGVGVGTAIESIELVKKLYHLLLRDRISVAIQ